MLLSMLKAVSKMLDRGDPLKLDVSFFTQVECAKTILDEIISNLDRKPKPLPVKDPKPTEKIALKEKTKPEPQAEVVTNGDEWMITLDESRYLVIKDFPPDGLVELDGKKMKYSETKGINFKKARIL